MQVAFYARVSTTRQAENDLSIPDQLRQLKEWAQSHGHMVVHEYVEPGASATDDKRPVFQRMIADSELSPKPFEAIIIHSLSRFFRDVVEFGVYERKLKKRGIKIISITQQTSEDASGNLMRQIFSTFDEYTSREISKHVTRAMKENARQGYFNGSHPPYGYDAASTEVSASRGRKKKKLAINEAEAGIVRKIYDFYLHGHRGHDMGIKQIAKHLDEKGILMRGKPWSIQKLHTILSDTLYKGDYYFNVNDSKLKLKRSPEEWIKTPIPAIVESSMFETVKIRREARAPNKTPPRVTTSPTLLTGLLKCGYCDSSMTLATGKSGRYKYYKCTKRMRFGNHACESSNYSMPTLDQLVINQLAETVFTEDRLKLMIEALQKNLKGFRNSKQQRLDELEKQLKQIEVKMGNLLDAIEKGIVDLDSTLQQRIQQLKSAREGLLIEKAGVHREHSVPIEHIKLSQIKAFGSALKQKLLSKDIGFAKRYVNILVDKIVVTNTEATITGSYAAIVHAIGGSHTTVPIFVQDWRARQDSNL